MSQLCMLIDSHAHLTESCFATELPLLLERAQKASIQTIINVCTTPVQLQKGLSLSQQYPWIYTAAATTPHTVAQDGETAFAVMQEAAQSRKLVAIGETGLDYHSHTETRTLQHLFLRRYLKLAKNSKLPVIIHCRDAFADLIRILDEEYSGFPGVLHCFTGTKEEAFQLLDRGWYISFSGIVTFKKSESLQEIASAIPLDQLLIETDAPYLAPVPYRGLTNEPAYLLATAQFLATLRAIPFPEFAAATTQNARSLFQL
jgi:TatD DNase family protein